MQLRLLMLGLGAALVAGTIWFAATAEDGKGFVQQASAQPPEAVKQEPAQPAIEATPAQSENQPAAEATSTEIVAEFQAFALSLWKPGLPGLGIPRSRFTQGAFAGVEFAEVAGSGSLPMAFGSTQGLFMTVVGPPDDVSMVILVMFFLDKGDAVPTFERFMSALSLATPKWSQRERLAWLRNFSKETDNATETPDYYLAMKTGLYENGAAWMMAGVRSRVPARTLAGSSRRLPLSATDPRSLFEVTIHRVLTGRECVRAGVAYDFEWERAAKAGKQLVYFDVSVKRVEGTGWRVPRDEHRVSCRDFKMVDSSGLTYSSKLPADYINGEIHKGRSVRGGICFAIYRENVPAELFYDPSITDSQSGRHLFVHFDSLQTLNVWSKRGSPIR